VPAGYSREAGAVGCTEGLPSWRTSRFAALPARVRGERTGSRCLLATTGQPEPGAVLRNVSAAEAHQRSQARRIFACADCTGCPFVCVQIRLLWRAHRVAGRWAGPADSAAAGCLPRAGEAHWPGVFGDSSPALTAETVCRRGIYGRRRGRPAGRLPSRSGWDANTKAVPSWMVTASSTRKRAVRARQPGGCSAFRDRLAGCGTAGQGCAAAPARVVVLA